MKMHEDAPLTERGYFCFLVKFQALEAIFTLDGPLLSGSGSHEVYLFTPNQYRLRVCTRRIENG